MNKEKHEFLLELLTTPSPSSMEMMIQKKWMEHMKPYADDIRTDNAGNVIAVLNPDAPFKVLLAGHCDEIAFVVTGASGDGFLYIDKMGGISAKIAVGMKITILGFGKTFTGVIGANAEHHGGVKEKLEFTDLYVDCGFSSKEEAEQYVQVGDLAVYKREPEVLHEKFLTGRGLDNRTGTYIVGEALKRLSKESIKVGVYAASTVNEETNLGGAYFASAGVDPTMAIACDVTFATDYPSVDKRKHGDIKLSGGPVLAKGAPINRKMNQLLEKAAKDLDMKVQYELTPRQTGTDADKMRYTGNGVPVALVSLPLRYMHSPVETVSFKDIEEEIDLLVHMIKNLQGTEDLCPLFE